MYNPKSKRTSKQIGAVKKKTLDGLTANKNIDDIRALSKISNVQTQEIKNVSSELSSVSSSVSSKQNKLKLTTTGSSGPATLSNDILNVPDYSLGMGITIGTTAIASGTVGRVLFQGTGNVVQQAAGLFYDAPNVRFGVGTSSPAFNFDVSGNARITTELYVGVLGTNGHVYLNRATTGGNVGGIRAQASGSEIGGGGFLDRILCGNGSGLFFYTWTGSGSGSNQRMQIFGTSGNVLIQNGGTFTDAGFRLDVNGTARVVNQLQVGSFTVGVAGSSSSIVTQGRISASGGITMYNPAAGDNQDTGIFPSGGVQVRHASSSVATFATVGGATSGTNVAINQGYNPASGTGSVIGYSHSYSLYPGADNTISYTSYYSRPFWQSTSFQNRITGPIRGFLFENSLYSSQKLIDVVAFQSNGGRLLFTGDLPAASVTSGISRGLYLNQTHTASANNDVLIGLDVDPTFINGAFTGVSNIAARLGGNLLFTQGGKTISIATPSTSGSGGGLTISAGNANTSGTGGSISLQPGNGAGGPGAGTVIISNTSWWNGATVNGTLTVTNSGPNTGTSLQVNAGGQNGLTIFWDNLTPFMQYGLVSNRQARFVNSSSYTFSSKVFIGTNVDAGFNFDVNGTSRLQGLTTFGSTNDFLISGTTVVNKGITRPAGNGNGIIFSENMQAGQIAFQFVGGGSLSGNSKGFLNIGGRSVFNINVGLGNPNTNNLDASVLLLDGIHNVTSFSGTIIRGIYYNPTLTSLVGVISHRAIQTTSGDILFGTTSGSVGIGANTLINQSAILDVTSTTQGFLPPRMTNAQMLAIATPAEGLVVYDTTNRKLCCYDGATWQNLF